MHWALGALVVLIGAVLNIAGVLALAAWREQASKPTAPEYPDPPTLLQSTSGRAGLGLVLLSSLFVFAFAFVLGGSLL